MSHLMYEYSLNHESQAKYNLRKGFHIINNASVPTTFSLRKLLARSREMVVLAMIFSYPYLIKLSWCIFKKPFSVLV